MTCLIYLDTPAARIIDFQRDSARSKTHALTLKVFPMLMFMLSLSLAMVAAVPTLVPVGVPR
jgi:hypothetical protein